MSSSFKYLDKAQVGAQPNKAQSFLDEKLAKNKHTIKQEDTGSKFDPSRYTPSQLSQLEANGGSAQDFGSQYQTTNQAEIDAWDAAPEYREDFYEGGWRAEKDSGEIGWSDTWNDGGHFQQIKGDGKLDPAYEERFNKLGSTGSDVDDHGAGWKSLKDMPTMDSLGELQSLASEWEKAGYDVRVQDIEGHDGVSEANIAVRKGQKGEKPEQQSEKIEHSPEIQQAKERVRTYENDVLSGKVSEDIYDPQSKDNYTFDASLGAEGIGTPLNGSRREQADLATDSFLDNKKEQVKKKYEFQGR